MNMSSLDNFVMVAKDQEAVDALIQLKVRDNSSPGIYQAVRRDLTKLRTFRMEYDIGTNKGRLPGYFSRTYGLQVAPYVILRDPGNNEFEVKVVKKNTRLYFTDGWAMLKNFYNIRAGAVMTMVYANRNLFLMRLADMYDEELAYPLYCPPKRFLLQNGYAASPSVACAPNILFMPTTFYHSYSKQLTKEDVTSGKLKLGWLGFCQAAFPAEERLMTVVDYLGCIWKCLLKLELTADMTCNLSGDWMELCNARQFKEGDTLKLGVTGEYNNTVVYLSAPPMLVLRTKLPPSTSSGVTGHVFNVEQYFWKN